MKYKIEIMEMARLACATVPDDLQDQMDISDDYFIEIRDYLERVMNADALPPSFGETEALTESVLEDMSNEFLDDE